MDVLYDEHGISKGKNHDEDVYFLNNLLTSY